MENENMEIIKYLQDKRIFYNITSIKNINKGAGGASIYKIIDNETEYVLKYCPNSVNEYIRNEILRELDFYNLNKKINLPFVPKITYLENNSNLGIIIVMYYYKPIEHNEWNNELFLKTIDLYVKINCLDCNIFNEINIKKEQIILDNDTKFKSYDLWNKIIYKHKYYFKNNVIDNIFKMLDLICSILNNEPHYICHGDFHPENILMNNHEIIICDWQCINIGKNISEISFFISRALDFGINIIENEIVEYYCQKLSEYKMENVDRQKIQKEKNASILYTTFIHWPYFLQNSNIERINIHYNNMYQAYNYLINKL